MKKFYAEVVSETLQIEANSVEAAEAKYDAYYDGEKCPDHPETFVGNCCVNYSDTDVYHNMEEAK